jgi:hypothetical protein
MGWIVAFVTIIALVVLGFALRDSEGDKGWRDQADGFKGTTGARRNSRRVAADVGHYSGRWPGAGRRGSI